MMGYGSSHFCDATELNLRRPALLTLVAGLSSLVVTPRVHALAAEAAFAHVTDRKEFDAAIRRARGRKMPTLVYFTAEWCALCKSINARVFSHPLIKVRLQRVALVRVDVTVLDAGARALMHYLRVPGPPTMFFVDTTDGREIPGTRLGGTVLPSQFLDAINLADH